MGKRIILFLTTIMLCVICFGFPDCVKAAEIISDASQSEVPNAVFSVSKFQNNGQNYIRYQLNGGKNHSSPIFSYTEDDLPVILKVPEREGYNFAGWYLDENLENKITSINDTEKRYTTVYAKWTKSIDDDYNVQSYNYNSLKLLLDSTERELKDCDYTFLDHIEIPGMPSTREMDSMQEKITSANQCPQGICMTDEYVLITSYCAEKKSNNLGCLYVFDKDDGTYLVTLGMKKKSHLGGIAFDGSNVWICHSDNNTIERVSYSYIKELAEGKSEKIIDCSENIEAFEVNNRPSCITYYRNKLYVATQTVFWNSRMKSYRYEGGNLVEDETYIVPNKVQGVAFDDGGSVYVSTSYGRTKSSYLKVYKSLPEMSRAPERPELKIEMPPCSEEITVEDGCVYVLFESAGYKYFEGTDGNGTSEAPLDKILSINISSM